MFLDNSELVLVPMFLAVAIVAIVRIAYRRRREEQEAMKHWLERDKRL